MNSKLFPGTVPRTSWDLSTAPEMADLSTMRKHYEVDTGKADTAPADGVLAGIDREVLNSYSIGVQNGNHRLKRQAATGPRAG